MRCVLGLAETVVTGCADGYARMAGKPAATLLHCGPGFANGIANMHNARRANSPMVNIVGDHATYHRPFDAPLTADTEGLARAVSHWVRTGASAARVGADGAAAVQAARTPPGQIATLILPADTRLERRRRSRRSRCRSRRARAGSAGDRAHDRARPAHAASRPCWCFPGAALVRARSACRASHRACHGREAAHADAGPAHGARPRARRRSIAFPTWSTARSKVLAGTRHVVLCGAKPPVGFFAYPGKPSLLWPTDASFMCWRGPSRTWSPRSKRSPMSSGAPKRRGDARRGAKPELVRGKFEPEGFGHHARGAAAGERIVAEEAVTSGRALFPPTFGAAPHDWLQITGGAIGQGFPAATGAAVACPDRKVVCLQADGAGMYTLQALWTQAREKLDVVNVIFANRIYKILHGELLAVGAQPGRASNDLFDLARPELDWIQARRRHGRGGHTRGDARGLRRCVPSACARRGPFLIEFRI